MLLGPRSDRADRAGNEADGQRSLAPCSSAPPCVGVCVRACVSALETGFVGGEKGVGEGGSVHVCHLHWRVVSLEKGYQLWRQLEELVTYAVRRMAQWDALVLARHCYFSLSFFFFFPSLADWQWGCVDHAA